jgi:hypothetical protein
MTPLQIEILLHYHSRPNDFNEGDFRAPAVYETIQKFAEDKALVLCSRDVKKYTLGERGKVFIDYLLSLELPTVTYAMQKAVMPPPADD